VPCHHGSMVNFSSARCSGTIIYSPWLYVSSFDRQDHFDGTSKMATDRDTSLYNLTGALIFSTYVVSALLLTLLICSSLRSQSQKLFKFEGAKRTIDLERRLQIFSALSVLSFSTLSYHMLSYLILSYQNWAKTNNLLLPQRVLGDAGLVGLKYERVELHIWEWLTSSTLFQDFAMTICNDSARFWWTQQALLVSMAWSVFMSFEGLRVSL
jgi:hypothetical protein